jgi:hypothetical protein
MTVLIGQGVWQQEAVEVARGAAETLPASAHGVMLAVLLAGVVMLFVGRRFLKAVFVGAGAVGALAFGYFVPSGLGLSVDPLITGLILAVVGAVVGWAAFRMTVAVVLGAVLALAGPIFTASFTGVDMHAPRAQETMGPLAPAEMLLEGVPLGPVQEGGAAQEVDAGKTKAAERVRVFVGGFTDELARYWNALAKDTRMTLFWSGVLGGLLGFALGLVLPKRAAAVVTSVLGGGLVIIAGSWFAFSYGIRLPGGSPENGGVPSPRFVAVMWGMLTAVGIGLQWTKKSARTDND